MQLNQEKLQNAPQQGRQANTQGHCMLYFSAFGNILFLQGETDASWSVHGVWNHIEYDSEEAAQKAIEKVNGMLFEPQESDADDASWCIDVLNGQQFDKQRMVCEKSLLRRNVEEELRRNLRNLFLLPLLKATESKKSGDAVSEKKFLLENLRRKSVPSSTANASKIKKKLGMQVSEKKITGKPQKKSVPSSTAKATVSKKSGYAVFSEEI
nr:polyadenylate-binding protein 8-like [Ipomoea batatas]